MAKNHAFLLVGPMIPNADELHDVLLREGDLLADGALTTPDVTQADLYRSGVEVRRTHKEEGLRRKDVEGSFARVVRRAEKRKAAVLFGSDAYAGADEGQRSLLLDAMSGFRTHIVITAERGTPGLDDLIDGWAAQLKPSRVHVLTLEEGETLEALLARVVELARVTREADLEKRIVKLKKKRSALKEQLEEIRSADQ
jgi:predicted Zn-dependent protease